MLHMFTDHVEIDASSEFSLLEEDCEEPRPSIK